MNPTFVLECQQTAKLEIQRIQTAFESLDLGGL